MSDFISTEPVHVIDDDGSYTDLVDQALRNWKMMHLGVDYHLLAILGSQSGGKSTLLNLLFGTTFMMMDPKQRRQCTKGIYLSHGNTEDVLVFDVEGCDGRERGESQQDFERKTSLFSFALAQVVIINIWTHDIGRYHGANLHLLRIVLELNLQLFQQGKNRTLLLFTLRDYDEATPVENLADTIRADMDKIWSDISKPTGFEATRFQDFFDIEYVTLPSKTLQPDKFLSQVGELRSRFVDASNPEYLWKPEYSRDIPIDGLGHYLAEIWKVIQSNKDLDLPLQKVMLAVHRCTQISDEKYANFTSGFETLQNEMKQSPEPLAHFGSTASELLSVALKSYDDESFRYEKETRIKKGSELSDKILADLRILFIDQLRKIRSRVAEKFETLIQREFPDKPEPVSNFAGAVQKVREETFDYFRSTVKASLIEGANWSVEDEETELTEQFEKRIAIERDNQLRKTNEFIQSKLKDQLVEPLKTILDKSDKDMWSKIHSRLEQSFSTARDILEPSLLGFNCSSDEIHQRLGELEQRIVALVKEIINDKAFERVQALLQKRFQVIFMYNRGTLPRQWGETDNIRAEHDAALLETRQLIDLHAIMRLTPESQSLSISTPEDFTGNIPNLPNEVSFVLSSTQCNQLREHLEGYARQLFIEARDAQERSRGSGQLRNFLIVLFLFFAYDDLWAYVQNPFIFMFTLLMGGSIGLLWYLNMLHIVTPYVMQGANQLVRTGQSYAAEYIPGAKAKKD